MAQSKDALTIRSYHVVFDAERRLHRIERWRIPLPYGIAVRSIGYALALIGLVLVLGALPIAGSLPGALPAWLRFVFVPLVGAMLLTELKIDGRVAHSAGQAALRHLAAPKRLVAFRARPAEELTALGDVALAPDERFARYRRGIVRGEGEAILRYPFRYRSGKRRAHVVPKRGRALWRAKRIHLQAGQEVRIG